MTKILIAQGDRVVIALADSDDAFVLDYGATQPGHLTVEALFPDRHDRAGVVYDEDYQGYGDELYACAPTRCVN